MFRRRTGVWWRRRGQWELPERKVLRGCRVWQELRGLLELLDCREFREWLGRKGLRELRD